MDRSEDEQGGWSQPREDLGVAWRVGDSKENQEMVCRSRTELVACNY